MEKNGVKIKVLFLDFDGVITHPGSKWNVDPEKVKLLEKIIKDTGAKIVVSSSWSVGCKNAEQFIERDFSGYFKNKTTEITRDSLFIQSIIDVTDHMGSARGDEIKRWLEAHEDEVESYVILDDDGDMLEEQLFNFVQTDGWYGMSDRTVYLATKVLNNEKITNPIRLNQELLLKWRLNISKIQENNIYQLMLDYEHRFKNN